MPTQFPGRKRKPVPTPRPNSYRRWQHMLQRCHNPKDNDYHRYGGRGIAVCDRWRFGNHELSGYWLFIQDMGEPPTKEHSIDRVDNMRGYTPENCRWTTVRAQANNRRSTKMYTAFGETKALSYWAEQFGIAQKTLAYRLKIGLHIEQALLLPVKRGQDFDFDEAKETPNGYQEPNEPVRGP